MEAAGVPNQPTEEAGITEEIIKKLQEKATVLTQERKKRGRTVPEDLMDQESLKLFKTLASHPVSISYIYLIIIITFILLIRKCNIINVLYLYFFV